MAPILSAPPIAATQEAYPPGGRHDNDFADFRKISVLPTAQEVASTAAPFLRTSDVIDDPSTENLREAIYLDNQFRLIREDMISELRDEVQIALGKQKGKKHRGFNVKGMRLVGVDMGPPERRTQWGLIFEFLEDLPQLKGLSAESRKAFFAKKDGSKMFKDQSLTCLLIDGEVVAFPSIRRDESLLSQEPPQIILTLGAQASVKFMLLKAKSTNNFQLLHMNTALFSFEPILLTLKRMKELPLVEEVLFWKDGKDVGMLSNPPLLRSRISKLSANPGLDVGALLGLQKSIILDKAQAKSLLSGLTQKLSIIQGPPGTGKSFIGALLAKFICDFSDQIILVVCYTNHALDQFLEELLDVGIPEHEMVRLGGKSTSRTEPMLLRHQARSHQFSRGDNTLIDQAKRDAGTRADALEHLFDQFLSSSLRNEDLWTHLEFEERDYFEAFQIPKSDDGMRRVGKKGKEVDKYDLLKRWRAGGNAGAFSNEPNVLAAQTIWRLPKDERKALEERWTQEIIMGQVDLVYDGAQRYDETQDELAAKFRERNIALLREKRIIGCTTTAAAKYASDIQEAGPQVVLVEEAGEILESHVITALGPSTRQLILIGDHKQLRPKVNNYNLTVEKGDGYDLNRSLFERLVIKGYPHHALVAQHRMRPEISALIRALTYPDLVDAPKTKNRDDIQGLQDNIIFINHAHPEDNNAAIADKRDLGAKSSKQNTFEAQMVLRVVRYLAQQGYGTRDIVVLTPYLGQLQTLREQLQGETDPVLNDLDSFELIQAGLLQPGAARAGKNPLRLATIDNYQGEESDIIVVSLTRSNAANDIGFMFSPERVNVLLSRARNGLIMIGNSHTFTHARKGRELWTKLITMLKHDGHIYDGLPVMCQQHPDRVAIIKTIAQFDDECPDGGCSESCGVKLNCGLHVCPSKCHRLQDHSKMPCPFTVPGRCVKGHDQSRKCSEPVPKTCRKCVKQAKEEADRQAKELASQRKRDEEEAEHLRKMKEIEDQLAQQRELLRYARRREDQANEIRLKMEDLENAKAAAERARQAKADSSDRPAQTPPASGGASTPTPGAGTLPPPKPSPSTNSPDKNANPSGSSSQSPSDPPNSTSPDTPFSLSPEQRRPSIYTSAPTTTELSPAERDWDYRKRTQGVLNPPLDIIMEMVGLETVKTQLLGILNKIDTAKRQNASLKDERFNITFLGNPGTGKTTVARQYGKFLSLVDALSGTLDVRSAG
ncbi:P-loop containing nucleoside triphosphate hydrolase protein [Hymenopellis radicata]|nr:P-loop containing nucleoside triphosphate hydrolase protein [Hymenopellis radicata]